MTQGLRTVGLFAGIGGIELGLESAGHTTVGLCEIEPTAQLVLDERWPGVERWDDVRTLPALPRADVLTAGFPCQDLSQAGRKTGIEGVNSGLVEHVMRLMRTQGAPHTLILENVSYMLQLDGGRGMDYLTEAIESLGMRWAYRVVDARSFGVPQRRQRVLMVASSELDPASILLTEDVGRDFNPADGIDEIDPLLKYGFYWTEGLRGLGWAREAVPTIKGGSGLGIPSPPAVWDVRSGDFGTPGLEDAERLQGFPPGWTSRVQFEGHRVGKRWKLVGNAVCVPMAAWLGQRLTAPTLERVREDGNPTRRWPNAAFGFAGHRAAADVSMFPQPPRYALSGFLRQETTTLSARASIGFLGRAERGRVRFPEGFLEALRQHVRRLSEAA